MVGGSAHETRGNGAISGWRFRSGSNRAWSQAGMSSLTSVVLDRGVRQGCPISPLLSSIYAEVMIIEAL